MQVLERASSKFGPSTSSKSTRVLAGLILMLGVAYLASALFIAEPHFEQKQNARLLFVHVPTVLVAYAGFFGTFVGSIIYLRKKSTFWDLFSGAAAEVGVVFSALMLATGAIWGKPTWGTYWEWDPRLTSSAVMFVTYLGYLAVRRMDIAAEARSRRAAVLGTVSFLNVLIVHYAVDWWRSLHQGQTFEASNIQIDGWYLFSFSLGLGFFGLVGIWMVIHRFRISWLEHQLEFIDLEEAVELRRSEGLNSQSSEPEQNMLEGV